jgi:predicted flap endonuclease-1-like 5' DNA nuclease
MTERRARAEAIVERSACWALATGLVPLPILDVAALTLIHVQMLEQLAALYERPFSRVRAEAYVAALLGSVTSAQLGFGFLRAGLFTIPVVGPLLGVASMSAAGASSTYGIGQIFINRFESGDTFLDFDPVSVQSDAREELPPSEAPTAPSSRPRGGAPDDLTSVKGIGPKIAKLLAQNGITTYAGLAATPASSLRAILREAGTSYAYHDPANWPEQARLIAEGRLDELEMLQSEMRR